ncbi:MAG: hypothetical protein ACFCVD_07815 [Nodosilinea sp.]
MKSNGFDWGRAVLVPVLTILTGMGLGATLLYGPHGLTMAGLPLVGLIVYPQIRYRRLVANYKRREKYLVQP